MSTYVADIFPTAIRFIASFFSSIMRDKWMMLF